jgi:hypothetical protein
MIRYSNFLKNIDRAEHVKINQNILKSGLKEEILLPKDLFVKLLLFICIFCIIEMKKQAHISHPTCKELKSFKVEGGYSLKYVASPTKSYLVNPKEGVIDYSDA